MKKIKVRKGKAKQQAPATSPFVPVFLTATVLSTSDKQQVNAHAANYIEILFVPIRVKGRSLSFLIDTGCTHHLQSRTVFNRLPAQMLKNLPNLSGFPCMPHIKQCHLHIEFLSQQDCSVVCDKALLLLGRQSLPVYRQDGRILVNQVQVTRTLVLPPDNSLQLPAQL